MSTQHTPGPWEHAAGSIGSNQGGLVAMLPCKAGHAGTARNLADAALIAAAPELLAALADLLAAVNEHTNDARLAIHRGVARAAIEKATGRQG